MKGIILAGGTGSRLYPLTKSVSKQLLPVYDKPLIYYPLSTLMLAGIKDILIITTPRDKIAFKNLLGNGNNLGIKISYKTQEKPNGIAEAFIIGKSFINNEDVCLVLGDNIFYGANFFEILQNSVKDVKNFKEAIVFGYYVNDPRAYGVVEFDQCNKVISIEEKPKNPKSNYALVGLYFYPNDVIKYAEKIKPSSRGELEITSINDLYLSSSRIKLKKLSRGYAWFDTGTHASLAEASEFIRALETRTSLKIGCIEEIAYKMGYIDKESLLKILNNTGNSSYMNYLKDLHSN